MKTLKRSIDTKFWGARMGVGMSMCSGEEVWPLKQFCMVPYQSIKDIIHLANSIALSMFGYKP